MKALFTFLGLLLIGALLTGLFLGNAELFRPSAHKAEAERIKAETDDIRAQTAYKERQRQISLAAEEQKAAAEVEALRARRARQLELVEPLSIAGTVVLSIAVLTLTAAIAYYVIAKARAMGEGRAPGSRQPVHRRTGPNPPTRQHGDITENDQPLPVRRANVRPDQVTYDGLLAYFYDELLHPNRRSVFSPAGLAPGVEATYLSILSEARIITRGTNGNSAWVLRRQIKGIKDLSLRISREAFEQFVISCSLPLTADPMFLKRDQFSAS